MIEKDKLEIGMRVWYIEDLGMKVAVASDIVTGFRNDGYHVYLSGQSIHLHIGRTDERFTQGGLYHYEIYATLDEALAAARAEAGKKAEQFRWQLRIVQENLADMQKILADINNRAEFRRDHEPTQSEIEAEYIRRGLPLPGETD